MLQALLSTENTTLVIVLMFVLLVLALILLPAASFIRLVELIRQNGSKVEAVHQDIRQAQTTLSSVQESVKNYNGVIDTRTMPESPVIPSTASTPVTKSHKSSSGSSSNV